MLNQAKTGKTKPRHNQTTVRRTDQNTLADARHATGLVRLYHADFQKADEKKKRKLADEQTVKGWEDSIVLATATVAGHKITVTTSVASTAAEVLARGGVAERLVDLKGEIQLRLADHPEIAAAFGFNMGIRPDSTPSLLAASEMVIAVWDDGRHKALLGEAGITAERIDGLRTARATLLSTDSTQKVSQSAKKGKTLTKQAALTEVRKNTVWIRKIAAHVFKGRKDMLTQWKSTLPRYRPAPRTPKLVVADQVTAQRTVEARLEAQPQAAEAKATAQLAQANPAATPEPATTPAVAAPAEPAQKTPHHRRDRFRARAKATKPTATTKTVRLAK